MLVLEFEPMVEYASGDCQGTQFDIHTCALLAD